MDVEAQVALSGAVSSRAALAGVRDRIAAWRADGSDHAAAQRFAGGAFLIRVASAGIIYLSQVLLARWMGRFEFGIYVYAWAWVGFLGMLSPLGVAYSAQRFIPEYRTRGDLDGLRGFLPEAAGSASALGIATGAAVAGTVLALGDRISAYYVVPFLLVSLTLPIFTVSSLQDSTARAFNWIDLALVPGYIAHPLTVIAVTGGFWLAGGAVSAVTTLATACAAFWVVVVVQMVLLDRRLGHTVAPGARRYEPLLLAQDRAAAVHRRQLLHPAHLCGHAGAPGLRRAGRHRGLLRRDQDARPRQLHLFRGVGGLRPPLQRISRRRRAR